MMESELCALCIQIFHVEQSTYVLSKMINHDVQGFLINSLLRCLAIAFKRCLQS